ncbi:hypothetical protein EYF80_020624 [Liparis tanakae]|uniref:Uncharacterized protein n=1 Tax=Liparis tanakae TaxID=230148 RepID=A0A4Z2HU03_9TELE|nr:hypothetical protein EYF80_020624 [Liparis tanakae]
MQGASLPIEGHQGFSVWLKDTSGIKPPSYHSKSILQIHSPMENTLGGIGSVQAQLYQVYSDPNMGRSPPATHLRKVTGISICALIKRPIGALVGRDWRSDWLTAGVCPPPLPSSLIPGLTTGERTNHKMPARSSKSTQHRSTPASRPAEDQTLHSSSALKTVKYRHTRYVTVGFVTKVPRDKET